MQPAGSLADGGTGSRIGLTVELYLGVLGWTDISTYVYYRDRVRITRGRPNETSRIVPQICSLTLDNRDGRFSPRNPAGPYYGYLGRNTQLRVSRLQNGVRRYRFVGEVPSWPTTWDISGTDVYVPIQAAGQLRRLQQGTQLLGSAMFRGYALSEAGSLTAVAYWPCEDGATATQISGGLPGTPPMSILGSPNLASDGSFVCSLPLPVLNGSVLSGVVPSYAGGSSNILRLLLAVPTSSSITDPTVIASMYTNGTIKRVDLRWRTAGALEVVGYDSSGTQLATTGPVAFAVNGQLLRVSMELNTNGTGVDLTVVTLVVGATNFTFFSTTLASSQVGNATRVVINPSGSITDVTVGHISYQSISDALTDLVDQLRAWNLESPGNRYARLAAEQGVSVGNFSPDFSKIGPSNSVTMGYQLSDTYANLIQQIADTDGCLIYEARDQAAIVRRSRISLYNQGTSYQPSLRGLTLDYALSQMSGPLNPLDDDAYTRNDITVQRLSGASATAVLASGALSTQAPPAGVGDYATTFSLSTGTDAGLPDHAHWRLHLGTVDEPRYPQIMLNLRHSQFTGNVDLLNQALTMDIGDLVVINNAPGWMPPDQIRQILQGYTETLGVFEHDMVLNCSPEAPYRVGMLEDQVLSRADTDGSTLAAALGPVLNTNPFFAGGSLSSWVAFRCSLAVVGTSGSSTPLPAGGPTGFGVLITPDGSALSCAAEQNTAAGRFAVTGTQTYLASALVFSPLGYATVTVGFDWLDASLAFISTSVSNTSVAAGVWSAVTQSHAAPANAAFAYVRVGLGGTPASTDVLYATSVVAWQGAVSVASANTLLPLWTTSAGAFPFDVGVSPLGSGGERMTVTGISGGSSPQSFTVARAVNGVASAQPVGADVRLWQPTTVSL